MKPTILYPNIFIDEAGDPWQKLPICVDSVGYKSTKVFGRTVRLHRLICDANHGAPPPGQNVARHLDGNKLNNAPENLRWGTQAENCQDSIRHGTFPMGERSSRSKLTLADVDEIKARRHAGEAGAALAAEFEVTQQTICDITKGRTWVRRTH